MGPELGFGWAVGDALDEQVLLLKTAWGGKDIDVDYRPPSVGGTTGWFYNQMVQIVRSTLKDLPTLFPSYSGSYELAGFAWHQGWNDACGKIGGGPDTKNCKTKHHCMHPDPSKYEEDLTALIKDLRKEFSDLPGGSKLPFSIGTSGMRCYGELEASGTFSNTSDPEMSGVDVGGVNDILTKYINPAQLAVGDPKKHPEFAGNVLSADTSSFYRKPSESPGKQCYHWNNNCESYWLVGQAMGKNMAKLIRGTSPSPPSPVPPSPSPPVPPSPTPPVPPSPTPPAPSECGACTVCFNPTNHKCQVDGAHRPKTKAACEAKGHIWCGPSASDSDNYV
jgi:alpha-galactosidase